MPDLTAADFEIYDNRVKQTVDSLSTEAMPLDVSIVVDLVDLSMTGAFE